MVDLVLATAVSTKPRRGRPPKITLDAVKQVGTLIAKGMTEEQACNLAGIKHSSFRTARSRNPAFEAAVKEAQARYLDKALDQIGQGGKGWQGMAWILERRHGEQFRRPSMGDSMVQMGPVNQIEVLVTKPLWKWSEQDLEFSVGNLRILKEWPVEQLKQLHQLSQSLWESRGQETAVRTAWLADILDAIRHKEAGGNFDWFSRTFGATKEQIVIAAGVVKVPIDFDHPPLALPSATGSPGPSG